MTTTHRLAARRTNHRDPAVEAGRPSDALPLPPMELAGARVQARVDGASLWIVIDGGGGELAVRAAFCPNNALEVTQASGSDDRWTIDLATSVGPMRSVVEWPTAAHPTLHVTTSVIPKEDTLVRSWPRDLVAVGPDAGGAGPEGTVHTSQRGPRTGVIYATMSAAPGTSSGWERFLYWQHLTSLNAYFTDTHTTPIDAVGGDWPVMGFRLPDSDTPLRGSRDYTISDVYLSVERTTGAARTEAATYLDLMAGLYLLVPKPNPGWHDWPEQADRVLLDLTFSPECSERDGNRRYLLPYVADRTKPPESMVQLTVLLALRDFGRWVGTAPRLADEIARGLASFYDPAVRSIGRWLPGRSFTEQSEEIQSRYAMDSWYLCHILFNLSRMAIDGDRDARRLFLRSLPAAIAIARRFDYRWPVFFDHRTHDVIRAEASPGAGGENDVGGLYANVMLQAQELTGKTEYLEEAARAADAMTGLGFRLGYQMNTTMLGAQAMLRLWSLRDDDRYGELLDWCLANFVDNLGLWECQYGTGPAQKTFFGSFPLHDAQYVAAYEEAEMVAIIHDLLAEDNGRIRASARLLLGEYLRHAQDRSWTYFPGHQSPDALSPKQRVGRLEPLLAVPVEDLTDGWQQSGQVGQEVYGSALAFVAATRHFRPLPRTHLRFHCDYPLADFKATGRRVTFRLTGDRRGTATVRLIPTDANAAVPAVSCSISGRSTAVAPTTSPEGHLLFRARGDAEVRITLASPRPKHVRR
jgi:hypothetical protein